jgi:hypothetical protein
MSLILTAASLMASPVLGADYPESFLLAASRPGLGVDTGYERNPPDEAADAAEAESGQPEDGAEDSSLATERPVVPPTGYRRPGTSRLTSVEIDNRERAAEIRAAEEMERGDATREAPAAHSRPGHGINRDRGRQYPSILELIGLRKKPEAAATAGKEIGADEQLPPADMASEEEAKPAVSTKRIKASDSQGSSIQSGTANTIAPETRAVIPAEWGSKPAEQLELPPSRAIDQSEPPVANVEQPSLPAAVPEDPAETVPSRLEPEPEMTDEAVPESDAEPAAAKPEPAVGSAPAVDAVNTDETKTEEPGKSRRTSTRPGLGIR